ncbi:Uncharacterised protein [Serratia proteamaculans]|uniref:hypothetical protein n=1 Tax=Serratia proteamaculans TaxID=28151 RepID=UPI002178C49F|nr:hypothetical protein [Serratia proteamaculans]CAI1579725.1 Uncharacterised protein [Serratia proteamaculans]
MTITAEIVSVARAMRDYIDALPADVVAALPTMPGFDRDWADEVIDVASREAQPVGYIDTRCLEGKYPTGGSWSLRPYDLSGVNQVTPIYLSAPPAPAVPDFKKLARELVENLVDCGGVDDCSIKQYLRWTEKTCRAAMLAQPVSQRYKLPEGFKLMPIEMTDEIAEAIAMEARCCGGIALCIYEAALAAAPEGGNG